MTDKFISMQQTASVVITKYEPGYSNGKEVTFFVLSVKLGEEHWELKKRYTEFHDLNQNLHDSHVKLPHFPAKSFFILKKQEDLDKRRDDLEKYIKDISGRLEFYSEPLFIDFMELKVHQPSYMLNQPEIKHKIAHPTMGYRDVFFSPNKKYYFTASSDQNALSRIDSYISNFSFPWDKKKETNKDKPVGALECWARIEDSSEFTYEKKWIKQLTSQCICLCFSEELMLVVVGCDDGSFTYLKLSGDDPSKYDQNQATIHTGRIMALSINAKRNLLYTIGEDKYVKIFDLQKKKVTYELAVTQDKPTNMMVDIEHQIAYILDRGGCLAVVTLATTPPSFKQSVKLCPGFDSLRGLDIDFESGLIHASATDSGLIFVYKILDRSDPEAKIQKIIVVPGAPFTRVLKYCHASRNIFVGHFNGILSIVNEEISDKGPIYSGKVHTENINQLQILNKGRNLVTASNDKTMKV
jgi:WD40 repeat protein